MTLLGLQRLQSQAFKSYFCNLNSVPIVCFLHLHMTLPHPSTPYMPYSKLCSHHRKSETRAFGQLGTLYGRSHAGTSCLPFILCSWFNMGSLGVFTANCSD